MNILQNVILVILKDIHMYFLAYPDVELFKLNPHKRSWILQSVKRFGDFNLENITIERSNSINKTNY